MHILCFNALKLLSGFFWLFLGQDLAFFGEDRLATLLLTLQERISQSVLLHFRQEDISQNLAETSLNPWL